MGNLYRIRTCPDCGRETLMHIKSKRCKSCQEEANRVHNAEHRRERAAGHTRKLGSKDFCARCGGAYTVASGLQRYCPDCAAQAVGDNIRSEARKRYRETYPTQADKDARQERRREERRKKWQIEQSCKQCGAPFIPDNPWQVCCCRECQEIRTAAIQHAADVKRRPRRRKKDDPVS